MIFVPPPYIYKHAYVNVNASVTGLTSLNKDKKMWLLRLREMVRPKKIARGCVAIYVGEKRKRYQVPVSYLSLPIFQCLIRDSNADDDFDFTIQGPITHSCDVLLFDQLLRIARNTLHTQPLSCF